MTYRVIVAAGAASQFHHLPEHARDALVARAAELVEAPWESASVLPPGDDPAFRETTFGEGQGLLDFQVDDATKSSGSLTSSGSNDRLNPDRGSQ